VQTLARTKWNALSRIRREEKAMKKVEDLKNYGKPLSDVMLGAEAKKYSRRIRRTLIAELRRELGLIGIMKLMLKLRKEINRGKTQDWSSLYEHGVTNRIFLNDVIRQMAAGKALVDMVGKDKASDIFRRILDQTADIGATILPSAEDFKACGDVVGSFKEYGKAMMAATVQSGLQEIELVEDSPRALAFNVKYCVWCEVAKKLGDPSICYFTSCYGDEVFFPKAVAAGGGRFTRTGTLATGAPVCDFRFELVSKP